MKKIRKPLAVLLLLVLTAALLLSGCHGAEEQIAFRTPESFDTAKNYEITFWAKNDTNMTQVNIYKRTIARFQEIYPNIKVTIRLYTNYNDIYNDVITNIATNTTPNVCITYPDHIATYLTGGNAVVPLDDLFTDPKYGLGGSEVKFDGPGQGEIVEKFLGECAFDGYHYAVPFMRSTEACYINRDYVEKLGYTVPDVLTWDFIWEVADKAAEKNPDGTYKVNGQKVMLPFIYKSTDNMMIQMLKQKNAGYSDFRGNIDMFNDTTKELLTTVAQHVESKGFSTFKISGYPANFLNAGQCIFAIDSTAGATWMGSHAPLSDISADKYVEFETAVRPIPQFDPEHPQMISQGPSVCIFNKEDPQEVLASWLFVQFLLTDDVQMAYSQTEGYVPVTTKAQNNAAYQDYLSRAGEDNELHYDVKIKAAQMLIDNIDNSFVTPVFNGSASLRNAAGQLIEKTAKTIRKGDKVDDAYFDSLFKEVISLHRLDQIAGTGPDGKADLGPLPKTSVILLCSLGAVWVLIVGYAGWHELKKKKS